MSSHRGAKTAEISSMELPARESCESGVVLREWPSPQSARIKELPCKVEKMGT